MLTQQERHFNCLRFRMNAAASALLVQQMILGAAGSCFELVMTGSYLVTLSRAFTDRIGGTLCICRWPLDLKHSVSQEQPEPLPCCCCCWDGKGPTWWWWWCGGGGGGGRGGTGS